MCSRVVDGVRAVHDISSFIMFQHDYAVAGEILEAFR